MSDQLVAETSTWQHDNGQTSMHPVGFDNTVSASERPQTYALDRVAIGTGKGGNHQYCEDKHQTTKLLMSTQALKVTLL